MAEQAPIFYKSTFMYVGRRFPECFTANALHSSAYCTSGEQQCACISHNSK
jgi:hypothetical protein